MSAETAIDEEEWTEGVYYDPETGDYVVFEFTDDTVREMHVFSDVELHVFNRDEFVEAQDDFLQIDENVVEHPDRVIEDVLSAAAEQPTAAHTGYDAIQIKYARMATIIKKAGSE